MIIFLEATNMIIKRLEIKNLHGIYNYNVSFNDDLTFIFGENGCGKTTILDIVSSIVTGRLYNLFSYDFDEIVLSYRKATKRSKLEKIRIRALDDAYEVSLNNSEIQEVIEDIRRPDEMYSRENDEYAFERRFMSMYKSPRFLKDTFNYIYLPLSRNSQDGTDMMDSIAYRRRRSMLYSEKDIVNKNYLNDSLRYVEEIIRTGCMRITTTENSINSKFRSNILTSSLKVTSEYNFMKLLDSVQDENTLSNIEKNRSEYIRTLHSLGEWNDDTNKRVENFFKKYRSTFEKMQQEGRNGGHGVTIDFLLMNMEFNRIKEIASQAQEIEREKEKVRTPITAFLNTVNDFFGIGEDKKHISISNVVKIRVEADSPHRKLSLYSLSSGEKQIIIIFACLIFGLPVGQSGIYIIDEPEASLHLAWQKSFVESIRRVNNSIQLIFATHAPEIIGKYSDHAVKLQKKINPLAKEMDDMYDE